MCRTKLRLKTDGKNNKFKKLKLVISLQSIVLARFHIFMNQHGLQNKKINIILL